MSEPLERKLEEIFHFKDSNLHYGIYHLMQQFWPEIQDFLNQIPLLFQRNNYNMIESSQKILILSLITDYLSLNYPMDKLRTMPPINDSNLNHEILFDWVNSDQLYYKIDDYSFNFVFQLANIYFYFITAKMEPEKANRNKEKKLFFIDKDKPFNFSDNASNKRITCNFELRTPHRDEMEQNCTISQERLNVALIEQLMEKFPFLNKIERFQMEFQTNLNRFTTKKYSDRFIHPNLKAHFEKSLQNYIKIGVLPEFFNKLSPNILLSNFQLYIAVFLEIANKLISILIRLENIKYFIYRKKKFIWKSNYDISLSLVSKDLFPLICVNTDQLDYWRILNVISEDEYEGLYFKEISLENFPTLFMNTEFFPELKNQILKGFQNFDAQLSGILINSDNWQGISFLLAKLSDKIDFVYIDPPYNTGVNDFIYDDQFLTASWLTMIKNRLELCKNLLKSNGIVFSSIDDNELAPFSQLVSQIFSEKLDNIVWHKKTQPSYLSKELITVTEYIIGAKKTNISLKLMGSFGDPKKLTEMINIGNSISTRLLSKDVLLIANGWSGTLKKGLYGKDRLSVELLNDEVEISKGKPNIDLELKSRFKWSQERIEKEITEGGLIHIKNIKSLRPTMERSYKKPIIKAPITLLSKKINDLPTNTDANAELKNLFQISPFDYSKPTALIQFLIRAVTYYSRSGFILDFFGGSGTTAHATILQNNQDQGNRKYIQIEKDDHFSSVLLPRLQKVMFSSIWKDGTPVKGEGSTIFQHHFALEQYCDIFANLEGFEEYYDFIPQIPNTSSLTYKLDIHNELTPLSFVQNQFATPFQYTLILSDNGILGRKLVNLPETFNFLLGLDIDHFDIFFSQNREYCVAIGKMNSNILNLSRFSINYGQHLVIIWRDITNLNLEEEIRIINKKYDEYLKSSFILFNAICSIEKSQLIEPIFIRLMFNEPTMYKNSQ